MSIGLDIKTVGKKFIKPEAIIDPLERAAIRKLARHGGLTQKITKRSMRRGRKARPSEYPDELKALLFGRDGTGAKWLGAGRDSKTGRFVERISDIQPTPKISARPDQSPKYWTKLLRNHIYFVVDRYRMSVIIGPADLPGQTPRDTPRVLEEGGVRMQKSGGEWIAIYEGGQPRRIRLARRRRKPVRYRGHKYVETSHAEALDRNMPEIWRDSV